MQTVLKPRPLAAAICADIQLKVASTFQERKAAFELVYNSYRRAGLCEESDCGLRFTAYQLLETTDIIVAELHGEVVSTMSLVRDGELGLPLEDIYPEQVSWRRAAGLRLAEVSCLADRRRSGSRFFGLFCEMSQIATQLAHRLDVEELLVAVHPRHAPLYRRSMAFQQIGDRREYPTVGGNPAVALSLNFANARKQRTTGWKNLFSRPIPADVLVPCPISNTDREHFLALVTETREPQLAVSDDSTEASESQAAGECRLCA